MKTFGKRIPHPRWMSGLAFALAPLFFGPVLFAQSVPPASIAQRLSPNTLFYVQWSGRSSLMDAEKKNHVLQLMEDPAMAPVWVMAAMHMQQGMKVPANPATALSPTDVLSFLDNSATFGVAAVTDAPKPAGPDSVAPRFGSFLIYDGTGKASLIQKIRSRLASGNAGKGPAEMTKYDFGGTPVEVWTTGKNVSYSAQAGNYFLVSDQKEIVEDLIGRFRQSDRPATSVTQVPGYAEMRKFIGSDSALEYFARIPDVSRLSGPGQDMKSVVQLADNLHLEKIQLFGGGIRFSGEATRFRGVVLGDTSPGGLFDLAGASSAAFQTQEVVNGSEAFNISRFDLPATYALIRGAVTARLTPQQASSVTMAEGMAQAYLGMPVVDALGLFTGEVATVNSYADDGAQEQTLAISIQKPDAVLRVVRALGGTKIVAEETVAGTTYLDIAYPYKDAKTGTQRKKFYYVAVTPQMLLAAPRKAMLWSTIQQPNAGTASAPAGGIFASPEYSQMRSRLPEKLSGLSGMDLSQIPWDKYLVHLEEWLAQSSNFKVTSQLPDLSFLKPEMITRHVHMSVGGWWKDSSGVYFDSYVQ